MDLYRQFGFIKQTALLMLCGLLPIICLAQQRSKADASKIVDDFVNCNTFIKDIKDIKFQKMSSSISLNEDLQKGKEAYYIFSTHANDKGFVIVSGDERMPAVLAYSDEDFFDFDNIPSNVRYWLDCYTEAFLALDNLDESNNRLTIAANPNGVTPLIENNRWGQSNPYNLMCPSVNHEKCVTGCVATAMAQVMNYHGYPLKGKGSISYYTETNRIHVQHDFSSIQFKWDDMIDDYSDNYTSEQADAVSKLMFSCGASVKMDYCTTKQGGSGAYQMDLVTAYIENFSYDKDAAFMARGYCSLEDWHRLLIKELNEGRPVNYGGMSIRDGGHSFVFDGYRIHEGNKYPDYHINWGWNGKCNGYYQIADLTPVEDDQSATMGGFNSSHQMTIGIKPEDGIDDGIFYLGTPNLNTSALTVKAGEKIQVYTNSCINFSYKDFSGTLHVALIPIDGSEEIILGESKVRTLVFMQELNNVSIDISLPSNLPEGQYALQLCSKLSKSDKYNYVISKSYPVITISETGNVSPVIIDNTMLGSSELELLKNSDPSLISLNIYELQNLNEAPFIGDLKMIFADKYGEQLIAFGNSIQTGELSMYEIRDEPINLHGTLSGNWPDGDYKIYVGARLDSTSDYVYVSYYDIANPGVYYQELCINAHIKNGNLIINDRSYDILPTSIKCIESISNKQIRYGIDGKQISQPVKSGLYIVKKSDGSTIKVFSK